MYRTSAGHMKALACYTVYLRLYVYDNANTTLGNYCAALRWTQYVVHPTF